jgi:hypothetical protein
MCDDDDEQSKVFCVNIGFVGGQKGRAPEWRRIFNRFVFTMMFFIKYIYSGEGQNMKSVRQNFCC